MNISSAQFIPGVHTVEEIEAEIHKNLHISKSCSYQKAPNSHKEFTKFCYEVYNEIKISDKEFKEKRAALDTLRLCLKRISPGMFEYKFGTVSIM